MAVNNQQLNYIYQELREIKTAQLSGNRLLERIYRKELSNMAKIDDVLTDVAEEKTLIDGLGAFIQGLKDQLIADGLDQAKVDAAFAAVEANKAELAAALAANVPAP